ncbi:glycosyltransferase family 2 protein [Fundidesulfovibrio butyratiphilus]
MTAERGLARTGFRPKVSVVMNCFNGERYLREAIESVFAQTYDNWEIVFWDNASTDASASIAKSYGEKVRYFRAESTTLLGPARVEAFARAQGDLVAMLDTDDRWEPEKLALQVPLFEADPMPGLVYCDAVLFDETGTRRAFFDTVRPARGRCFAELLRSNFICTGTMVFSRAALDGVRPLFEPDMTMVMDYLLTLKVAYAHGLDYVDRPLVGNRVHSGSESTKKWDRFAVELKRACENLAATLPGIERRFGPELDAAQERADMELAMNAWIAGDPAKTRNILAPRATWPARLIRLGTRLYPWPFPAEHLRRAKHALAGLLGRPRSPFRTHGGRDESFSATKGKQCRR